MSANPSGWRPSAPANEQSEIQTVTGNRALMLEEPLIFEMDGGQTTGVDFAEIPQGASRLGGLERSRPIGLPGLSEPEAVRHYTRLSRQNYAIDLGLFPLGSCTMKHNPRLNEKVARLPGFADVHPLQPQETVQGALQVINELAFWLLDLTGMHGVAMSPKAGAHGELCGLLCIRAALEARGDKRAVVLVPESAHGTNPATAAFAGYRVENIPANAAGRVDLGALKARLGPDVAAVMITNPNTCGLFEPDMIAISEAVHAAGAFVYCDGANFNAIVGKVRPGDLGIDAMHINLHKTFSTPHGGGGAWLRPGGVVGSARALRAAAVCGEVSGWNLQAGRGGACRRRASRCLRADGRLPRPDGHVHAGFGLHPQPRRRRPQAGRGGRGAQRQLHPAQPRGRARRAVRRKRAVHA